MSASRGPVDVLRRGGILALAAIVPLITIVALWGGTGERLAATAAPHSTSLAKAAAPSASGFAGKLVGVANQYAKEHGDPARIANAHCVQAAPGAYICSYMVEKPGGRKQCHLIQARWTPGQASSFTTTLSGRTSRCNS